MPAQAGKPSIQKIKNESAENKPNGLVKAISRRISVRALQKRALQNFEGGGEPAKQIPRRHQIRQEINFGRLLVHLIREARNNC